ncbi:VWA domain-containing protein [Mycolicibacterium neoaurum]|uniref:VWA domain-containing protein n=1 Tax=Mycolicibacterium neoaurum TaxID=1795 RepID=UPI0026718858|nr:VWA domain-containing protein [Mycolicibacterium neoaurum]MDO3399898.1 VWA domain-containing protein [Mycolicibacterium neoaurum]
MLSAPAAAVAERWHAGDQFGVLCTGDALIAEELYRVLAPTADHVFGNAEAVAPEDLAVLTGDRIVALAWTLGDVHPALLRRCTAVLDCGDVSGLARIVRRSPDDLVEASIRILDAAGVHDHGVEIATARLVDGLHRGGCADPLWVVRTVVADPRRRKIADSDGESGSEDEHGEPDAGADPEDYTDSLEGSESGETDVIQQDSPTEVDRPEPGDYGRDDVTESQTPGADIAPSAPDVDATEVSAGTSVQGESSDGAQGAASAQVGAVGQGLAVSQAGDGVWPGLGTDPIRIDATLLQGRRRGRWHAKQHLRGARGAGSLSSEHGRVVRVVSPVRAGGRVAILPSLARAARRRASTGARDGQPLRLVRDDLRGAIRRRRGGHHTVVIVDGSSSLDGAGLRTAGGVTEQVVAAINARRGVVSVVVAAGQRARVAVLRSTSLARTRAAMTMTQTGGGTPLAHAMQLAMELLDGDEKARRRVLVVSDGRPTVGLSGTHLATGQARAEISALLGELTRRVSDVILVPVGCESPTDMALFATAGVRLAEKVE